MKKTIYLEPFLIERIAAAEKKARDLIDGVTPDQEALEAILRWRLCLHYGKPYYWKYVDDRTIDEMVFELELIKLSKQSNVQRGSDMLSSAPKEEQDALFEDWNEIDSSVASKSFDEDAKAFMQTGEFKK